MKSRAIFISYSWANKEVVDKIDSDFQNFGIKLQRDIRDSEYATSIKEFMQKIKEADFVLMVISREFLKSENCMYEVTELIEDKNYKDRFLPIVLKDTNIFKTEGIIEYINYWDSRYKSLNEKFKTINEVDLSTNLQEELKKVKNIRKHFDNFAMDIKYINSKTLEELQNSNYEPILYKIGYLKRSKLKIIKEAILNFFKRRDRRKLTIKERIKKFFKTIFIIFLSYLILTLTLNQFDAELNPEIKAILEKEEIVKDEDNAFFMLLGFNAPADKDPIEYAKEIVKEDNKEFKKNPLAGGVDLTKFEKIKFKGDRELVCDFTNNLGCEVNETIINQMLEDNKILLERYSELKKYTKIKDLLSYTVLSPTINYLNLVSIHGLILNELLLKSINKNLNEVLKMLNENTRTWRILFNYSSDLVSKMVIYTILRENYNFISYIIKNHKLNSENIKVVKNILKPLDIKLSMEKVMIGEAKIWFNTFKFFVHIPNNYSFLKDYVFSKELKEQTFLKIILNLFAIATYQPNDTINLFLPILLVKTKISSNKLFKLQNTKENETYSIYLSDLKYLFYNQTGYFGFRNISISTYIHNMFAVYSLDNLLKLINLQLQLKNKSSIEIKRFIEDEEKYYNLFTNKPMKYDEEKNIIYFENFTTDSYKENKKVILDSEEDNESMYYIKVHL